MRYESLIGLRYLRSRRSRFISVITVISVLGVAVGVWALIVVLSVMSGFENDLRDKILGTHAHLLVEGSGMHLYDSEKLMPIIMEDPDVVAASPFLLGEVMLSSQTNLAAVGLKGVHAHLAGEVNNLKHDLVEGDLDWLEHPEKIQPGYLEHGLGSPGMGRVDTGVRLPAPPGSDGDDPTNSTEEPNGLAAPAPVATPALVPTPNSGQTPTPQVPREADDVAEENSFVMPSLPGIKDSSQLPPIIIGRELKRNLLVAVGDEITVVSPLGDLGPTGPTPKARSFRVAGVFYTGMYEYDTKVTYTSISTAQSFFNAPQRASGIEVQVKKVDRTARAVARLGEKLGSPQRVRDWRELNQSLFAALKLEKLAMFIILTFVVLVASFNIVSNLIMVVLEKGKEIAILKSMGATRGSVMAIFITEGLVIGSIGMALGLILGLGTCAIIGGYGIPLDPEVYYISNLPVAVDMLEVVLVCLAAVLISFVATLYPSLQAARLEPVEGLRYD